jgi:hypothetical protein
VGPRELAATWRRLTQDLEGESDQRQGVAQLMAEHGQELVLAPVRIAQGLLDQSLRLPLPAIVLGALGVGDVASDRLILDDGPSRIEESSPPKATGG